MDKMQAYDNDLRVPMVVRGPGIDAGSNLPVVAGHTDILPTLLALAGVHPMPEWVDGRSLVVDLIKPTNPADVQAWPVSVQETYMRSQQRRKGATAGGHIVRTDYLTEYWGLVDQADPLYHDGHILDCSNNSWIGIRRIDAAGENLLYAEYTDTITNWDFSRPAYRIELYNVSEDPFQLTNIYDTTPTAVRESLHNKLRQLWACRGSQQCEGS